MGSKIVLNDNEIPCQVFLLRYLKIYNKPCHSVSYSVVMWATKASFLSLARYFHITVTWLCNLSVPWGLLTSCAFSHLSASSFSLSSRLSLPFPSLLKRDNILSLPVWQALVLGLAVQRLNILFRLDCLGQSLMRTLKHSIQLFKQEKKRIRLTVCHSVTRKRETSHQFIKRW